MIPKYSRRVDQTAIERVRARDSYCQVCGKPRTDVHHIASRGSGGPDAADNLIGLCRTCHTRAHAGNISRGRLRRILAEKYGFEYLEWELREDAPTGRVMGLSLSQEA